jgi:pimeloyl-ACP methyl ester carboxylesterase
VEAHARVALAFLPERRYVRRTEALRVLVESRMSLISKTRTRLAASMVAIWRCRPLRVGLLVFAVLWLAVVAMVSVGGRSWIAHGIVVAPNAGVTFRAEGDVLSERDRRLGIDEHLRVNVTSLGVASSMSIWLVEPGVPARGTVLVLHGIRSDKTWVAGLAKQIAEEGYLSVLPDLPGHGRSSGDWLTYGVREAGDLKALLDELGRLGRLKGQVGIVGISYGAAVGIQAAAVDARIRAVVAVAPFSSLRAIVPRYVEHYIPLLGGLIPDSFIQQSIDQAGVLAQFDPDAASPLKAISRTRAQILLVHWRLDRHIPCQHSVELHAAALDHSELILLGGEDHLSIPADRTRTIATHGMQWLHRWLEGAVTSSDVSPTPSQ